jgi:hypothetical protein
MMNMSPAGNSNWGWMPNHYIYHSQSFMLSLARIVSPSTVLEASGSVQRLYEAGPPLSDELVQRSGQGMAPTPRARAIWPAVREALAQLQSSLIPNEFVPAEANTSFVLAMSDARNAQISAISSGVPSRPTGMPATIFSSTAGGTAATISVEV